MKKFTTITVNGERWTVPRGFGAWYRREAADQMRLFRAGKPGEIIGGIIGLMRTVGFEPTVAAVADWPMRKRVEAVVYCAVVALRASDNAIQRHPDLPWLPEPWKGKPLDTSHIRADLRGAFDGPGPTEISA